jgi:hypothetical protein
MRLWHLLQEEVSENQNKEETISKMTQVIDLLREDVKYLI